MSENINSLFDASQMPDAPKEGTTPKRKSYYVPVAQRRAEEAKAKASKKKENKPYKKVNLISSKPAKAKSSKTEPVKSKKSSPKETGSKSHSGSDICSLCHKPLTRHTSVSAGMGDTCQMKIKLLPKGTSMEDHYAALQVQDVPNGYIKLKDAIEKLNAKGISTYRILQAIGGDRMLRKPINNHFKVVLVGRVRYINGESVKNWKELEKV